MLSFRLTCFNQSSKSFKSLSYDGAKNSNSYSNLLFQLRAQQTIQRSFSTEKSNLIALVDAIKKGNHQEAKELVIENKNLLSEQITDYKHPNNDHTALQVIITKDNKTEDDNNLVDFMIKHSTEPELYQRCHCTKRRTAWMYAIEKNNYRIVKAILDRSSNQEFLNIKDERGKTAFDYAIENWIKSRRLEEEQDKISAANILVCLADHPGVKTYYDMKSVYGDCVEEARRTIEKKRIKDMSNKFCEEFKTKAEHHIQEIGNKYLENLNRKRIGPGGKTS